MYGTKRSPHYSVGAFLSHSFQFDSVITSVTRIRGLWQILVRSSSQSEETMARLTIPESDQEGILSLLTLDNLSVEAISRALAGTPASASTKMLTASIATSRTGKAMQRFSANQMYGALRALRSLYGVRSDLEVPLDEFVDDLMLAIKEISPRPISKTRAPAFKKKLLKLLGVERVQTYANVQNIKQSDERVYCKAKIYTDLRAITSSDDSEPKGFVINHRLQLGYHQDGGHHTNFYLSLDDEDLDALALAIEQAKRRAATLLSHFEVIE
jgi:hypothetical protein